MFAFLAQVHTPVPASNDIREIYGYVPIERFTPAEITALSASALVAIALIILAGLTYLAYRKRKAFGPALTPIQIAQRDLNLLKIHPPSTDALWGQSMSEILRNFLEKEYHIPAVKSTTQELHTRLTAFPKPMAESVLQVLERCDVARFAAKSLSNDAKAELISLAEGTVRPIAIEAEKASSLTQPDDNA